ncbi:DUF4389 domain-containing protein [Cryobacterium sp. BB307]|uniref:DUF4389 domain-containing protein n=1 Tax=Cryobacterium sp. BB307 TaxID=2716317 RepID=UPI0032C0EB1E
MTISAPETDPRRLRMSGLHMFLLIAGVLGAAGSHRLLGDIDLLGWGIGALAASVALILFGAVGLGRSIRSTPIAPDGYPTRLEGQLDPALSRGMWLVKWLLAFPHYIVLAILWAAFPIVVLASGLAILFTGRYPASLFEFVVGVLRWNWRVVFYATGVLATDQYPPFTLARTDFPATFDVAYPDRLSRWKVLVKSWLLALPHLIIVGILAGLLWVFSDGPGVGGLVGLLVFIAALILLFTGVYNSGLFNLVMGIHRWIYRVYSYTSLLRDDYPPFRLDQGPLEPAYR